MNYFYYLKQQIYIFIAALLGAAIAYSIPVWLGLRKSHSFCIKSLIIPLLSFIFIGALFKFWLNEKFDR